MSDASPVLKDGANEHPVPSAWRPTIERIVASLAADELPCVPGVMPMTTELLEYISLNVECYGVRLVSLPEETWQSSVCQWMIDYWQVLVDLYSEEEGRSDLVLFLRVYEREGSYEMEVTSVHVP